MSEALQPTEPEKVSVDPTMKTHALIIYGLQTLGFALGFTWIISVIYAFVVRYKTTDEVCRSHFTNALKIFFYSIAWMLISLPLLIPMFLYPENPNSWIVGTGFIVISVCVTVWTVYRLVTGWVRILDERKY